MPELSDRRGTRAQFDDRGRLLRLVSRGQDHTFAEPDSGWRVGVDDGGACEQLSSAGALPRLAASGQRLIAVFEGLRRADGRSLPGRVTATWWLADGLLHGQLAVAGLPAGTKLLELTLPVLAVAWQDAAATTLTIPTGTGYVLQHAAADLFNGREAVSFGVTEFQCFGWAEGGHGLYLDTRDTQGWVRRWTLRRAAAGVLRIEQTCLAPGDADPAAGWQLPYAVSVGGYDGQWYDLGRVYRTWALRQPWAQRGPAERRHSYFAELACWVWNRGRIDQVVPPVQELAARLGLPVGLDWYWWHQHGYDTEYPTWFPPREGTARFRAAVTALQAGGVAVQVYTNGMTVDQDGAAWDPIGPAAAQVRADGEVVSHAFNTFTKHRLAFCCGDVEAWHETVSAWVAESRTLGLDGLYLDMIGNAGGYLACHATHHGHPPGGGCYGVQGFRRLLARLRAEQPGYPLSTEATQEQYLDLVEGNIILDCSAERWNWQRRAGCDSAVVPLFQSIYHGRLVGFGNYAFLDGIPPFDDLWPAEYRLDPAAERDWHALCPDQFAFEVARTVSFGLQPMVCNLTAGQLADPDLAPDLEFLLHLARGFHRLREYLLWGELLPPGALHCATPEVAFLQRYIFTPPGQERILKLPRPAVLQSAWRAPDGTARLLLLNWTRQAAAFEWSPPAGWRLAAAMPAGLPARGWWDGELLPESTDG
ncbi:MAG: hypothetical protein IT204_21300 [Fimbriimonadaceae bacterium]|nr:hypothetical protein [Fimbriimonadaceae bacterium]